MKLDWQDYPLGLLMVAARSSAGGIITLMVSLFLGTQLGYLALEGHLWLPNDAEELIFFFFCFIGPICLSCIALWGFLYVVFIVWIGHLLIYQDAPRLRTGGYIVFPQFMCTVIAVGVMERLNTEDVTRILIVAPLVAALSAAPWIFNWIIRKRS